MTYIFNILPNPLQKYLANFFPTTPPHALLAKGGRGCRGNLKSNLCRCGADPPHHGRDPDRPKRGWGGGQKVVHRNAYVFIDGSVDNLWISLWVMWITLTHRNIAARALHVDAGARWPLRPVCYAPDRCCVHALYITLNYATICFYATRKSLITLKNIIHNLSTLWITLSTV